MFMPGMLTPEMARQLNEMAAKMRRDQLLPLSGSPVENRYLADGRRVTLTGEGVSELIVIGKLNGTLNHNSSVGMSVWAYNGSADADTGRDITVHTWMTNTGDSLASGTEVIAMFIGGRWRVVQAECQA